MKLLERHFRIKINISQNSVSSSILGILESHVGASETSHYIDQIDTPIFKLDTIFKNSFENKNIFLKIDTQGYEWNVLKGGINFIKNVKGILIETSIEPLYKDQVLINEIKNFLESNNFKIWGYQSGFTDPQNGKTLQLDLIFVKKNII